MKPKDSQFQGFMVETERDLLLAFINVLNKHRPDIISGFNDNSFDWIVITERLQHYGLIKELYEAVSLESLHRIATSAKQSNISRDRFMQ